MNRRGYYYPNDWGQLASDADKIVLSELPRYDALLIGCGLGRESSTREFIEKLFTTGQSSSNQRSALGFNQPIISDHTETQTVTMPPTVIDADGLVLLSQIENWWEHLPEQTIITPPPAGKWRSLLAQTSRRYKKIGGRSLVAKLKSGISPYC